MVDAENYWSAALSATAGGTRYGVDKKANIIAVKVLNDNGYVQTTTWSSISSLILIIR